VIIYPGSHGFIPQTPVLVSSGMKNHIQSIVHQWQLCYLQNMEYI